MAKFIEPVRGMNDILPEEMARWRRLEELTREVVESYGYREIRLPVVEKTELFKRSIGDTTDIVEKEMYTFIDRSEESLTLRPEATAGMVRAGLSNGLLYNQVQRLWCAGPMFRHERPQKGRYRQFHQIDVEAFGLASPDIDAELMSMTARLWKRLGLSQVELQINSLGTPESRAAYRERLVAYFEPHRDALDEDSRRRLGTNPLRILDSKAPETRALVERAPSLVEHLDEESRRHFERLQQLLSDAGLAYSVNPRLVRGLDYYTRTVFEWTTSRLGAQDAVCSGGRYDGLVAQLGGKPTPATGFAMGMERLVALMQEEGVEAAATAPHVYLVRVGDGAERAGFTLAETLRDALPGLRLTVDCGGGSFGSQLKRADKSGAHVALILGEDETSARRVALKPLRGGEQEEVSWDALPGRLMNLVKTLD
ncbi:MAG TPA: histidine--tRNA ligase [Gammaproteobacteria bacterium]|nr:histidine--tRNA ligase [Gammaproteobacteria bacterium]